MAASFLTCLTGAFVPAGFMGVLMCEGCAATTPELPPSAFQATQPACDPTDAELTADEALAAAAHGDGMDAAGSAGAVEDYLHQPYLTRRTWSVEEHEGSEQQNAPWARVALRWLMSGMARGGVERPQQLFQGCGRGSAGAPDAAVVVCARRRQPLLARGGVHVLRHSRTRSALYVCCAVLGRGPLARSVAESCARANDGRARPGASHSSSDYNGTWLPQVVRW